jgi:hypothetical protein
MRIFIRVDANDFGFYRSRCEQFLADEVVDRDARRVLTSRVTVNTKKRSCWTNGEVAFAVAPHSGVHVVVQSCMEDAGTRSLDRLDE